MTTSALSMLHQIVASVDDAAVTATLDGRDRLISVIGFPTLDDSS